MQMTIITNREIKALRNEHDRIQSIKIRKGILVDNFDDIFNEKIAQELEEEEAAKRNSIQLQSPEW